MVAFEDAQILDITGPLEVFGRCARWLKERAACAHDAYTVEIVAAKRGPVATSSLIRICADRAFSEVGGPVDTLLVAGGRGTPRAMADRSLVSWIAHIAPRVRRLCSVCTGAFLLAEAGLLAGRGATTHWSHCERFARRYPDIFVRPDEIFVRDGNIFTSAGVTAGIDLALALIEQDHGRQVALAVARELVVFLKRPGGQSQFSAQLAGQLADREPIRELQTWVASHLDADLSVEALARRAAMSPRNFARVFTREVAATPGAFVETSRVEAARRRLEESDDGVDAIASACGFGTRESMRRAFLRSLRVAPTAYRARFRRRDSAPTTRLSA